jgi:hypothetical protein
LIEVIRKRFGRIDVVEYGPISGEQSFSPVTKPDAVTRRKDSPLLVLTPVEELNRRRIAEASGARGVHPGCGAIRVLFA